MAEVDVDLDTGEVHVRCVVSADDVGRVIHPVLAEGQVEGGTLQAVGYATIEEMKLEDGRYLNDRLATYLIPTALDAPRITAILVEEPFSGAPHGAKGVGELPDGRRGAGDRRRHPRRGRRLDHRAARDAGARPRSDPGGADSVVVIAHATLGAIIQSMRQLINARRTIELHAAVKERARQEGVSVEHARQSPARSAPSEVDDRGRQTSSARSRPPGLTVRVTPRTIRAPAR